MSYWKVWKIFHEPEEDLSCHPLGIVVAPTVVDALVTASKKFQISDDQLNAKYVKNASYADTCFNLESGVSLGGSGLEF